MSDRPWETDETVGGEGLKKSAQDAQLVGNRPAEGEKPQNLETTGRAAAGRNDRQLAPPRDMPAEPQAHEPAGAGRSAGAHREESSEQRRGRDDQQQREAANEQAASTRGRQLPPPPVGSETHAANASGGSGEEHNHIPARPDGQKDSQRQREDTTEQRQPRHVERQLPPPPEPGKERHEGDAGKRNTSPNTTTETIGEQRGAERGSLGDRHSSDAAPLRDADEAQRRLSELREQGHGPQRHEGDITPQQCRDRVGQWELDEDGNRQRGENGRYIRTGMIDPETGLAGSHYCGEESGRIPNPVDYCSAEDRTRSAAQAKFDADPTRKHATVSIPASEVYTNPAEHCEGWRIRSDGGFDAADMSDANLVATYIKDDSGAVRLHTMYPSSRARNVRSLR